MGSSPPATIRSQGPVADVDIDPGGVVPAEGTSSTTRSLTSAPGHIMPAEADCQEPCCELGGVGSCEPALVCLCWFESGESGRATPWPKDHPSTPSFDGSLFDPYSEVPCVRPSIEGRPSTEVSVARWDQFEFGK